MLSYSIFDLRSLKIFIDGVLMHGYNNTTKLIYTKGNNGIKLVCYFQISSSSVTDILRRDLENHVFEVSSTYVPIGEEVSVLEKNMNSLLGDIFNAKGEIEFEINNEDPVFKITFREVK